MKISVITVCLNSDKHIEQTIQSVLAQRNCDIEYVVVDGKSTDNTLDIIEKYRDKIDKFLSEKDKSNYEAYNKGIHLATGDVLYFLNADDYFHDPYVLERIVTKFEENPDCKAVYGNVLKINDMTGQSLVFGHALSDQVVQKGQNIPHQGLFVKKHMFDQYQGFDLQYRFLGDFDFVAKLFKDHADQLVYVKETVAFYRANGLSGIPANIERCRAEQVDIVEKYFGNPYGLERYQAPNINIEYYRKWIELLLYHPDRSCSSSLVKEGIRHVAIFGTVDVSVYMLGDLRKNKIEVYAFLDNNPVTHGSSIDNVEIYSPEWLRENVKKLDAIIFAFEGSHEQALKEQIANIIHPESIRCISWRELVSMNLR